MKAGFLAGQLHQTAALLSQVHLINCQPMCDEAPAWVIAVKHSLMSISDRGAHHMYLFRSEPALTSCLRIFFPFFFQRKNRLVWHLRCSAHNTQPLSSKSPKVSQRNERGHEIPSCCHTVWAGRKQFPQLSCNPGAASNKHCSALCSLFLNIKHLVTQQKIQQRHMKHNLESTARNTGLLA